MMIGRVLIISADKLQARKLLRVCDGLEVGVDVVESFDDAVSYLNSGSARLIIGDYESVLQMWSYRPGIPLVVVSSRSDGQQIIESVKRGVLDYVTEPIGEVELERRLRQALALADQGSAGPAGPDRKDAGLLGGTRMIGQSPAIQDVYRHIGIFAPKQLNVLITGESGTGKELVARSIVEHSPRADEPYMAINCAAIPENLLESELFGHEKGAFTGADRRRIGRFEQCHGGTLLLDEIGDLPLATQGKLLRVLQEHTLHRVGSNTSIACDVRVIAATHQPLEQLIEQKRFRQDLYYRLKVATIHMPALREREVDAVLLAHYFMDRFGPEMGSEIRSFSPEAVACLLAYPWPGNVRELENVIRTSLAMARGSVFLAVYLPEHIRNCRTGLKPKSFSDADPPPRNAGKAQSDPLALPEAVAEWSARWLAQQTPDTDAGLLALAVARFERILIRESLSKNEGNLTASAAQLGISRTTLRTKMKHHGLIVKAVTDNA